MNYYTINMGDNVDSGWATLLLIVYHFSDMDGLLVKILMTFRINLIGVTSEVLILSFINLMSDNFHSPIYHGSTFLRSMMIGSHIGALRIQVHIWYFLWKMDLTSLKWMEQSQGYAPGIKGLFLCSISLYLSIFHHSRLDLVLSDHHLSICICFPCRRRPNIF